MRVQVGRVCAVAAVVVWLPTAMVFAETKAERARLAAQLVGDALRQEVDGTNGVRAEKLQSALEKVPDHEAALWQSGYVLERKKWRNPDEVAALAAGDLRLAAYRRQRETTSDTIEGQLALAQWCAKRRLTDQRRAHLTAVLQIDPNHAKARRHGTLLNRVRDR